MPRVYNLLCGSLDNLETQNLRNFSSACQVLAQNVRRTAAKYVGTELTCLSVCPFVT